MFNTSQNTACVDNTSVPDYTTAYTISDNVVIGSLIFILLVNLCGNIIVVGVILFRRRMQTFTNWMILNLAIADLSVALYCITLEIPLEIYDKWIYEKFFCTILYPIQSATIYGSVFTLLVLSCSRYWAIVYPFKRQPTTFAAKICIAAIWLTSLALVTPYMIALEYDENDTHCKEVWSDQQRSVFTSLTFLFQYVFPLTVVIIAYAFIAYDVVKQGNQSKKLYTDKRKTRENRKLTRLLLVITLTFAICVLPYHAVTIAVEFGNGGCYKYIADITIGSYLLLYLNSALNPIMYNLFSTHFRQGFIESYKKGQTFLRSSTLNSFRLSGRFSGKAQRSDTQVTYCRKSGHFIQVMNQTTKEMSSRCDISFNPVPCL